MKLQTIWELGRQTMHCLRNISLVIVVILMLGCSRVKIVYHQLDWLLPYYLGTYMDLSAQQSNYLDQQVKIILQWHCSQQLASYTKILRDANSQFQTGSMTPEAINSYSERIKQLWAELMQQVSPVFTHLLMTASDEQLQEFFAGLEERNQEWLEEFNEQSENELRQEYMEKTSEELVRWFGPLQAGQKMAVRKWLQRFQPLGLEGLHMRRKRQTMLHELLQYGKEKRVLQSGIEHMLLYPEKIRAPAYQKRLDENLDATVEMLYQIGKQLSLTQRRHLTGEVEAIANDFDDLACQSDNKLALAGFGFNSETLIHGSFPLR